MSVDIRCVCLFQTSLLLNGSANRLETSPLHSFFPHPFVENKLDPEVVQMWQPQNTDRIWYPGMIVEDKKTWAFYLKDGKCYFSWVTVAKVHQKYVNTRHLWTVGGHRWRTGLLVTDKDSHHARKGNFVSNHIPVQSLCF